MGIFGTIFGSHPSQLREQDALYQCLAQLTPEDRLTSKIPADHQIVHASCQICLSEYVILEGQIFESRARSGPIHTAIEDAVRQSARKLARELKGDFALVFRDDDRDRLILHRDLGGQIPLFVSRISGHWLVASHPLPLAAANGFEVNAVTLAAQACAPSRRIDTVWHNVHAVPNGETWALNRSSDEIDVIAVPTLPSLAPVRSIEEWAEEYRSLLDRAIRDRISPGAKISTHLSSGLDSSAVTARAAALLPDTRDLVAITDAPAMDGSPFPRYRFGDESEGAARTAKALGISHRILREDGSDLLCVIERDMALKGEPCLPPIPVRWWSACRDAAKESGAQTLLTATLGNLSLNWGGLPILRDYLDHRGPVSALRQAIKAHGQNPVRWRGIMAAAFPELIGGNESPVSSPFVFERMELQAQHYPRGNRDYRLAAIQDSDYGMIRKAAKLGWDIDEYDPTGDSRLIQWSLALPPEAFMQDGHYRPVAKAALRDQIPADILAPRQRGTQLSDWPHWFRAETARQMWEEGRASDFARELFDFDAMDRAIRDWPRNKFNLSPAYETYSLYLSNALSAAYFLAKFVPEKKLTMRSAS